VHADLDRLTATSPQRRQVSDVPRVEPVRGLRRRIAERLTQSWTEIPHITYVDEVDATEVEALRSELNRREEGSGRRLTLLPFIVRGLVIACRDQPRLNATYDAAAGSLSVFDAMHVGIATQTPDGLVVPVVRHAESLGLWELAGEIGRLAEAARAGTATREELSGSTITITSLGALGGLVTTPIINQPEVAIIGVNKLETRAVWRDGAFVPRLMFNLSSSFDHRIIDGWDAATFVQRLKSLLEMPALMFMDDAE
jgi:2-oxoisovalerate dehydrogenase E2 component (dihydrolipoyl transacylase)